MTLMPDDFTLCPRCDRWLDKGEQCQCPIRPTPEDYHTPSEAWEPGRE